MPKVHEPQFGDSEEFPDDIIDFGPCCACGKEDKTVRNIICHSFEQHPDDPHPGWGCFQCDLPAKGATSIICDDCLEKENEIKEIIFGYPAEKKRVDLTDEIRFWTFEHDLSRHPEVNLDFNEDL